MKFAHIADCHVGSWRDPRLKDTGARAFIMAIDKCIEKKVDFVIIAGDLFNTSFPRLEGLKVVTGKLRELKEKGVGVYVVPGSHDYSPSGKTILDVLEEAGLFVNVFKGVVEGGKLKLNFVVDSKTGVKLTGILGKRGALEKIYYENLMLDHLENEDGYKIFLFHSGVDELKPKKMENVDSQPISLLPKNFNYYAGGHIHIVQDKQIEGYGRVAYPGPLFPNSFSELEELEKGGFYIVEDDKVEWHSVEVHKVFKIRIDCSNLNSSQIMERILEEIGDKDFVNTIVLIRLEGIMDGKPSEVNFKIVFDKFYSNNAYFVMRSTTKLKSKDYEEVKIDAKDIENIENELIKENIGQVEVEGDEAELVKELIKVLDSEKDESERVADFEKRVMDDLGRLLRLE
tara:strand:- start:31065 stop:32264 length:1200 start_codon:yes stop_codon:yes gene_type:complete